LWGGTKRFREENGAESFSIFPPMVLDKHWLL